MTIKECIDTVDNIKPNQYETREKVLWLSFIDEIIINDVLKTHEGYDGRYDDFAGYSEDKLSVPLIVPSPYDRLYTAYLKMKIDGENGETARYNNSAALFNTYMMEYRKYYNKTHLPISRGYKPAPIRKPNAAVSEAELENLKRELYHILYNDVCAMTSSDKINDVVRSYMSTNAEMFKGEDGKDGAKGDKGDKGEKGENGLDAPSVQTTDGTIVSQNADFAEVAEWWDGNPNNEDRTGYFVCANVPVEGIVMKKATSTDDVKGVSILAPAFAGNYTKDKLDSNGKLKPKYSYVAIIGFVPVIDKGRCEVGGRCMPDDDGCAIPSSNNMGYQVVNRVDENRVLIIIEPNGDMVQRIKTKVNQIQEDMGGKISMWQPNTYYKVGNYCIASQVSGVGNNKADYKHFLYRCKVEHTSSEDIHYDSGNYWDRFDITVDQSAKDGLGNFIVDTYATKQELADEIANNKMRLLNSFTFDTEVTSVEFTQTDNGIAYKDIPLKKYLIHTYSPKSTIATSNVYSVVYIKLTAETPYYTTGIGLGGAIVSPNNATYGLVEADVDKRILIHNGGSTQNGYDTTMRYHTILSGYSQSIGTVLKRVENPIIEGIRWQTNDGNVPFSIGTRIEIWGCE